jgi:hypothetical protein
VGRQIEYQPQLPDLWLQHLVLQLVELGHRRWISLQWPLDMHLKPDLSRLLQSVVIDLLALRELGNRFEALAI